MSIMNEALGDSGKAAAVAHCLEKIRGLAEIAQPSFREPFQMGYNLGRLSELLPGGRERFWDPWKTAVDSWDQVAMRQLLEDLKHVSQP